MTDYSQCSCTGKNLDKFIKPILLALLKHNSTHGYALLSQLNESGLFSDDFPIPDASGVYRFLSDMEKQGLVDLTWDTESAGPAKRIYSITRQGVECLNHWDATLDRYERRIEAIRQLIQK